jgi:uncharacterized protein YodC (DUF2158 family)
MTVESLTADGRAECVWFDAEGNLCRLTYPVRALVVVPEGEP